MKKIFNFVLVLVLGFALFPSIASADIKEVDGTTYSRSNIDYSLNDEDYLYMFGIMSPTEFIIYNDDSYEYYFFKNGAYREENASLAEIMRTRENMMENNSIFNEYNYNEEYEILKIDHAEEKDSNGQCYKLSNDLTAQDGVTYYIIQEYENITAEPVLEFNEDDIFHYYVKTECKDEFTGDKLTETQIAKLNDVYDIIDQENEEIYANKFNIGLESFPFLVENKYINIFVTRYTNTNINYNEELFDPTEFEYRYSYYDLDGNKLEELDGYTYMAYLQKSNLIVAKDASNLYVLDTDFNVLFTEENPYYGYYLNYSYFIFDIDANRLVLDLGEGSAIMITRYVILDGEEQTYSGEDLVLRTSGEVSLLDKVYVNDVELSNDNYVISEGSTIITLKDAYLRTLDNASYTLKATYTDGGEVETSFVVNNVTPAPESNPRTGDTISNALLLAGISLLTLISLSITNKKNLIKKLKLAI